MKKMDCIMFFIPLIMRILKLRGKTIQSVMQATGKNLENLETVKDFCLSQMETV